MSSPDDAECVAKTLDGNTSAFDVLVERYFRMVFIVAYGYLHHHEAAEELTQEVFLRAYLNLHTLKNPQCLPAWLNQIATNQALSWIAQGRRRSELVPMVPIEDAHEMIPDGRAASPRRNAADKEEASLLHDAILELEPAQRSIVLLHLSEGITRQETARRLGMHPSTVGRHLDAALRALKKRLGPRMDSAPERAAARVSPRRDAVARTLVVIAGASALTGPAKAALAAAAATAAYQAPVAGAAVLTAVKALALAAKTKAVAGAVAALTGIICVTALVRDVPVTRAFSPTGGGDSRPGLRTAVRGWLGGRAAQTPSPAADDQAVPGSDDWSWPDDVRVNRASPAVARRGNRARAGSSSHGASRPAASVAGPNAVGMLEVIGRVALQGGAPATSAVVHLLNPRLLLRSLPQPEAPAKTADPDGSFSLQAPDQRHYVLHVSCPGAASANIFLQAERDTPSDALQAGHVRRIRQDVELLPLARIAGRVETTAGRPVSGVLVTGIGKDMFSSRPETGSRIAFAQTTSTADGRFLFDDVATGPLRLLIDDEKYVPLAHDLPAPAEDIVLRLKTEGASIGGSVVDKVTRKGMARASVTVETNDQSLRPRTVRAGSNGSFRIDRLPAGTHRLSATVEGITFSGAGSEKQVQLAEGETTGGVELLVVPALVLNGRVTEKGTGAALAGVRVILDTLSRPEGHTDEEGYYQIEVEPPYGTGNVRAEKPGYVVAKPDNPAAGSQMVHLQPDRPIATWDLQMEKAVAVSGVVVMHNDTPAAGAVVSLVTGDCVEASRRLQTTCNARGVFDLYAPPFSTVAFKATTPGYPGGHSSPVAITDRPTSDVRIVIGLPGSISGTVTDPEGRPVEGATVYCYAHIDIGGGNCSDYHCETKSRLNGEFDLQGLPSMEHTLYGEQKGYVRSDSLRAAVRPGEIQRVEVRLQKGHFIAGRVTDESGKPVKGGNVNGHSQTHATGFVDIKDGRYRLDGLPDGLYELTLHSRSGDYATTKGIAVDRDDVDIVVKKVPTSGQPSQSHTVVMRGKVLDAATKAPVENFTVTLPFGFYALTKDRSTPGVFSVPVEPGRDHEFGIEAPGYAPRKKVSVHAPADKSEFEHIFELGKGGVLKGRVTERRTGTPISGIHVISKGVLQYEHEVAQAITLISTVTDADGRFRLQALAEGKNYVMLAQKPTGKGLSKSFDVKDNQETDAGDVVIGADCTVRGRVVRGPGEEPVARTRVQIHCYTTEDRQETTADDKGAFEFSKLLAARYEVTPADSGQKWNADLSEKNDEQMVLRLGEAQLKGVISGGIPSSQYWVTLSMEKDSRSVETAARPNVPFEFRNMEPGTWNYSVQIIGGYSGRALPSRTGSVELSGGVNEETFAMPSSTIRGRVVDADGTPVPGASVVLGTARNAAGGDVPASIPPEQHTDPDGVFQYPGIAAGEYSVTALHDQKGSAFARASVKEGETVQVVLKLGQSGGTLVSTALNYTTGAGIPEAWCHLYTPGGQFSHRSARDSSGRMTIKSIPAGTYEVEVSSFGFSVNRHSVTIREDETATLDDVLYDAGALNWRLKSASGIPLADVPCRLVPRDPGSIEKERAGITNTEGLWVARGLYPGVYLGTATPPGAAPISVELTITAHQLTEQESRSR